MTRARKKRTIKATRRRSSMRSPAIRQTVAGKAKSGAAARERLRLRKRYRIVGNIPEHLGRTTTAYAILAQIRKHKGNATFNHIRARLPKVPLPTIRFYLGKFQREKIVAGA